MTNKEIKMKDVLRHEAVKSVLPLYIMALLCFGAGFFLTEPAIEFILMVAGWFFLGRAGGFITGAAEAGRIVDVMAKQHEEKERKRKLDELNGR